MIQRDSSLNETGEPCWKQADAYFKADGHEIDEIWFEIDERLF